MCPDVGTNRSDIGAHRGTPGVWISPPSRVTQRQVVSAATTRTSMRPRLGIVLYASAPSIAPRTSAFNRDTAVSSGVSATAISTRTSRFLG